MNQQQLPLLQRPVGLGLGGPGNLGAGGPSMLSQLDAAQLMSLQANGQHQLHLLAGHGGGQSFLGTDASAVHQLNNQLLLQRNAQQQQQLQAAMSSNAFLAMNRGGQQLPFQQQQQQRPLPLQTSDQSARLILPGQQVQMFNRVYNGNNGVTTSKILTNHPQLSLRPQQGGAASHLLHHSLLPQAGAGIRPQGAALPNFNRQAGSGISPLNGINGPLKVTPRTNTVTTYNTVNNLRPSGMQPAGQTLQQAILNPMNTTTTRTLILPNGNPITVVQQQQPPHSLQQQQQQVGNLAHLRQQQALLDLRARMGNSGTQQQQQALLNGQRLNLTAAQLRSLGIVSSEGMPLLAQQNNQGSKNNAMLDITQLLGQGRPDTVQQLQQAKNAVALQQQLLQQQQQLLQKQQQQLLQQQQQLANGRSTSAAPGQQLYMTSGTLAGMERAASSIPPSTFAPPPTNQQLYSKMGLVAQHSHIFASENSRAANLSGGNYLSGQDVSGMAAGASNRGEEVYAAQYNTAPYPRSGSFASLDGIRNVGLAEQLMVPHANSAHTTALPSPSGGSDHGSSAASQDGAKFAGTTTSEPDADRGASKAKGQEMFAILASIGQELARHGISIETAASAGWLGVLNATDMALLREVHQEEQHRVLALHLSSGDSLTEAQIAASTPSDRGHGSCAGSSPQDGAMSPGGKSDGHLTKGKGMGVDQELGLQARSSSMGGLGPQLGGRVAEMGESDLGALDVNLEELMAQQQMMMMQDELSVEAAGKGVGGDAAVAGFEAERQFSAYAYSFFADGAELGLGENLGLLALGEGALEEEGDLPTLADVTPAEQATGAALDGGDAQADVSKVEAPQVEAVKETEAAEEDVKVHSNVSSPSSSVAGSDEGSIQGPRAGEVPVVKANGDLASRFAQLDLGCGFF